VRSSVLYAPLTFCHDLSRSILKSSLKSRPNTSHSNRQRVNLLLSNSCSRWYGSSCREENRERSARDMFVHISWSYKGTFEENLETVILKKTTSLTEPGHPNRMWRLNWDRQLPAVLIDIAYLWFTIIVLASFKEPCVFSMPECVLMFSVSLWSREIPLKRKRYM